MSFPAEGVESAIKNHIDDVRAFLDARHANSYAVYNLSQRTYRVAKFQNRVSVFKDILLPRNPLHYIDQRNLLRELIYEYFIRRSQNVAGLREKHLPYKICLLYARICICGCDRILKIYVLFTV